MSCLVLSRGNGIGPQPNPRILARASRLRAPCAPRLCPNSLPTRWAFPRLLVLAPLLDGGLRTSVGSAMLRSCRRAFLAADDVSRARLLAQAQTCAHAHVRARSPMDHFGHAGPTRAVAATQSGPELGLPLPHLRRDWAHPCHICTGSGPAGMGRAAAAPAQSFGPGGCRRTRPSSSRRWKRSCGARRRSSRRSPSRQAAAPRPPDEALPAGGASAGVGR